MENFIELNDEDLLNINGGGGILALAGGIVGGTLGLLGGTIGMIASGDHNPNILWKGTVDGALALGAAGIVVPEP